MPRHRYGMPCQKVSAGVGREWVSHEFLAGGQGAALWRWCSLSSHGNCAFPLWKSRLIARPRAEAKKDRRTKGHQEAKMKQHPKGRSHSPFLFGRCPWRLSFHHSLFIEYIYSNPSMEYDLVCLVDNVVVISMPTRTHTANSHRRPHARRRICGEVKVIIFDVSARDLLDNIRHS